MQRTLAACLILLSVACSSCSDFIPTKKKIELYKLVSSTNDSLDKMTREWHQQLFFSTKDKSFARLQPYRVRIGQFLSRNRAAIASMPMNSTTQNLLDTENAFLATQANLFSDTYSTFESYNEITPNATIDNQLRVASTNLSNMISSKAAIDKTLQFYARRNDLKPEDLAAVKK